MKILLVEDERDMSRVVSAVLRHEGYDVDVAPDGVVAVELVNKESYDCIVMDVMMPRKDGITALREIRASGDMTPIIMLTAKAEIEDRIQGLDSGADDYITKPFLPKELLLRIGAVLRRCYSLDENTSDIILGESRVSIEGGIVKKNGDVITLTAKELTLFSILYRNRGRIVTTDILCEELWPDGSFGLENSLIVHMRHLREKIEKDPSKPIFLKTVRGLGYKMEKI